ncbi:MAG: DUF4399 domain-containing protein [Burkholderiales bacterium]|nr:DUF4399 domain-containing protein [Burkholderiales bacterium]
MKIRTLILAVAQIAILHSAYAAGATLNFVDLADGATVTSPFKVKFDVKGMEVKPAGDMTVGTGHHHLLINAEALKEGESVPFDETHLHFGKGQTETELKLAPGKYKLTLQFANGAHQSYGPQASKSINITVK